MKLELLKPKVRQLAEKLISECEKKGCKIKIYCTYRTIKEQDELYAKGRTKPGKIITYAKGGYSFHNYGVAFDAAPLVNNKIDWNNVALFNSIGKIGEELGLEWGGSWTKFKDRPHFQYTASYSIKDFLNNKVNLNKFMPNKLEEALKKYNLKKIRDLINKLILSKDSNGKKFVVKEVCDGECIMASLINKLAKNYNSQFTVLQLPKYTTIDENNNIVIMPFYGEQNYVNLWNSGGLYGGKNMKLGLVKEMVQIIHDFSRINISKIIRHLKKHQIANFQFDFNDWKKQFASNAKLFLQKKWLSQEELDKANKLLKKGFKKSKLIFNNGDYYPRNLLSFKDKIVVIDWQTWSKNYRANIIDYTENVAAFAFIHMWENRKWQIEFLRELRKYFRINFKNLRKAILIKSFEQAIFFGGLNRKKQFLIFKNILNDRYVKNLKKNTKTSLRYKIVKKRNK